jgi:hypothetical protein
MQIVFGRLKDNYIVVYWGNVVTYVLMIFFVCPYFYSPEAERHLKKSGAGMVWKIHVLGLGVGEKQRGVNQHALQLEKI